MTKKYKRSALALCLAAVLALTGCGLVDSGQESASDAGAVTSGNEAAADTAETDDIALAINAGIDLTAMDLSVSDRDLDPSFDESAATVITFTDSSAIISGGGAVADGTTVTLSEAGTYIFSGSCSDGRIVVSAADTDKLQLVFKGLTLSSGDACPLLIAQADKVFLTLAEGTESTLSDAASYTLTADDTNVDAAIFSKASLTINGSGTLTVQGNYKHGVVSKDALAITGGTLSVTAVSSGIEGKDSVIISDGVISVTSGTDGIRATNTEDAAKGFVCMTGGSVSINAGNDGIQAETLAYVSGGTLSVVAGGGSVNAAPHASGAGGQGMWGGQFNQAAQTTLTDTEDAASTKGIKSGQNLLITGGDITADAADDAIHAGHIILIDGGQQQLTAGDDGIHSDLSLTVLSGNTVIAESYEGLEAPSIAIAGGSVDITASDDGFNAAGGTAASGTAANGFAEGGSYSLEISGGYVVVNASGDGLDSNGSITISGGVVLVSGPTGSGNGALDSGGEATITGGVVLAVGSSGMAETFSQDSSQGWILTDVDTQSGGSTVALCDESGTVLASFTPSKQYQNVVCSAPEIASGSTYTIRVGGTAAGADANGYTSGTAYTGGTVLATIQMTALYYGQSSGMGGMGGGRGNGAAQDDTFPGGMRPGSQNGMPPANQSDMPSDTQGT